MTLLQSFISTCVRFSKICFAFYQVFIVQFLIQFDFVMALVNVDEDSWLSEYSALERLSQTIQRNITDRDAQNSTSGKIIKYFFV